jgi:hypothetical protein
LPAAEAELRRACGRRGAHRRDLHDAPRRLGRRQLAEPRRDEEQREAEGSRSTASQGVSSSAKDGPTLAIRRPSACACAPSRAGYRLMNAREPTCPK